MERLRMKDMPVEDRPYEKLEKSGEKSLTDAELLAIIIRTGSRDDTSLDLTRRIINKHSDGRGLQYLKKASISQLCEIKGVGRVKAIQIKAAMELGSRLLIPSTEKGRHRISSPDDIGALYIEKFRNLNREYFTVLVLNTRNEIIRELNISIGSLSETVVHPREVFSEVMKEPAAAVVLMHNHPSGDPAPSKNDKETTKRLVEAGKILGIRILDHVIIGDGNMFSFKENGLL
ncbi:MAG: DNA repair protein RadC [Clostridia bacterium]|nr:DNA repair protein RadC [Clostridia bacterium]MBN2883946.1 DNA repair protein RadC [Clostridia bacterium]